ncbi:MAG: heparinase II/III family protein [Alphaproteobacteria bacterium]|nr:heparinase II/III family protein [Alphaproteobacteria bacterium]
MARGGADGRQAERGIGRRLREAWYGSPLYAWRIARRGPDTAAAVVTDAWPGDPDAGREILEGAFAVLGQTVQVGADPWSAEGLTPAALDTLHRFDWLRDLRDLGGDAARRRARDLVAGWIARHGRWNRVAWRPDVLGCRIAVWAGTYAFFAESAEDGFRHAVLDSLATQHGHLIGVLPTLAPGPGQIDALRGALIGAVCLGGDPDGLQPLAEQLEHAVEAQVLPDGGHVSRSPDRQAAVLAGLVDARAALRASGRDSTPVLDEAIGRMTGVLRLLRHGDGGLALFNGTTEETVWKLDALLARTESKVRAVASAPNTGFERLTAGRTALIVDTGVPDASSGVAHAGTLAFELSVGKERLVVNCGAAPAEPRWDSVLKASAAHSTLVIDDVNSTEIRPDGSIGRRPSMVRTERWEDGGALWLEAEHDGYLGSHGLTHRRRFYLAAGGDDLRGEEVLTYTGAPGQKPVEAVIRFHLHPRVAASIVQNGAAALLRLSSGAGWRLRASDGGVALNESVYFGDRGRMQRTRQLVIRLPLDRVREDGAVSVKWALRREDRRGG